jgi:hypothetical protein
LFVLISINYINASYVITDAFISASVIQHLIRRDLIKNDEYINIYNDDPQLFIHKNFSYQPYYCFEEIKYFVRSGRKGCNYLSIFYLRMICTVSHDISFRSLDLVNINNDAT